MIIGSDIILKSQELFGTPYEMGGKTIAELDCSGFIVYVMKGLQYTDLPDGIHPSDFEGGGAEQIFQFCKHAGTLISVEKARRVAGALLFRIVDGNTKHVAFSTGANDTIEARGEGYGCGQFQMRPAWTHAALIPKIFYGEGS